LAYHAKLRKTGHNMVAKYPRLPKSKKEDNHKEMMLELKKRGIVISLAHQYNTELKKKDGPIWARIQFVDMLLFQTEDDRMYSLEGFIEGKYEKYTNNFDYLDSRKETRHLTAFAHFSYERSKQQYLVTDFQGVKGFLLTDPSIHSKTGEFYDSGDFSTKGFVKFFSKHTCNDICQRLELKPPELKLKATGLWMETSFLHSISPRFKCNARICNRDVKSQNEIWCDFCKPLLSTESEAKCIGCKKNFIFRELEYFMFGMKLPKQCEFCCGTKFKITDLYDRTENEGTSVI